MSDMHLALIRVSGGGGSYARRDTEEEAKRACWEFFESDWKPPQGHDVEMSVVRYDSDGPIVVWDHSGFFYKQKEPDKATRVYVPDDDIKIVTMHT